MAIITAERVSRDPSDNFVFQRSLLAYHYAAQLIDGGDVLEVGTGSGYGVDIIAPRADRFVTMDKQPPAIDNLPSNCEVIRAVAPKLPFGDNSFDWVVTFQVIEHIDNDSEFIAEIARVLRPTGCLIISTPNAPMSLTRNPWHVREYTAEQFTTLLSSSFTNVTAKGVAGDSKIMEYYQRNREGVERITRFDIFDLQHRLPRQLLQLPYDILNRLNRRRLLRQNHDLTTQIELDNYTISNDLDIAFDLLYTARR
ncbi:MAG: class I SAM-dependent methyltransferase [Rikenellaceae bacterium]